MAVFRLKRTLTSLMVLAAFMPFAADAQLSRSGSAEAQQRNAAERGSHTQFALLPQEALRQNRLLTTTFAAVQPQRRGTVDAYVLSVAMDSDPIFGREAAEAGRVLSRRFGSTGRTIVLSNGSGAGPTVAAASPTAIAAALGRIGEVMDKQEDVLVLYVTTHGHWVTGLAWKDGDRGAGNIGPVMLAAMLEDAGIQNRLLILSACFSGVFVPMLEGPRTYILTAASADRTSFGCQALNDWTFFGDSFINTQLRKPISVPAAFEASKTELQGWEQEYRFAPSNPQSSKGAEVDRWLAPLELRRPTTATSPVGQPARNLLPREPAAPAPARP